MKNLILIAFVFIAFKNVNAQSCCATKTNFTSFLKDKKFIASHLEPKKSTKKPILGKLENFSCPDGTPSTAYVIKGKSEPEYILYVIHEWWGMNDYIKNEAEKYYLALGKKCWVVCLDLYDGKVATTRDSAGVYMKNAKEDRIKNILQGANYKFAAKNEKIFTVGWCFGGGWSLQTALACQKKAIGCVMYYGMPEKSIDKLKKINCPVLMHHAKKDQWINDKVVEQFESDMKTAKKALTVQVYNADHAFANPSNPKYNKEFGDVAFASSVKFFKNIIKTRY